MYKLLLLAIICALGSPGLVAQSLSTDSAKSDGASTSSIVGLGKNAYDDAARAILEGQVQIPLKESKTTIKSPEETSTWENLVALQTPLASKSSEPSADDNKKIQKQHKAAVLAARDFYSRFPNSDKAGEARKIEVRVALIGAQLGDAELMDAAPSLSKAYRQDKKLTARDRLEIAVLSDTPELSRQLAGKSTSSRGPIRYEYIRNLQSEFGDIPEIHFLYRDLMLTCARGDKMASTVARELVSNKSVIETLHNEASAYLAREKLIGTVPLLQLVSTDKKEIDLKAFRGKVAVLYAWSPSWEAGDPTKLDKLVQSLPSGTQWIYIALATSETQKKNTKKLPYPGLECSYQGGFESDIAKQLGLTQCPYVFVLDKTGKLVGHGPQSELPTLLTEATQR
jgi:hypothetical protein